MARLVLLVTSPRVAAGLLSADAWSALRAGPVLTATADSPQLAPLTAAGIAVRLVDAARSAAESARELLGAAGSTGSATWLVAPDGDAAVAHAVAELAVDGDTIEVEVLHGSWDLPGARLLDVVATMDRLRAPGGCPWDAEQDHATLAPYLLEEAYEAFQAIEDDDSDALREELGDVLLQVVFHARLAEELAEDERWSIDDVAGGLVAKLIRRHPHVFAGLAVEGADEVNANWEAIKAAERGDASVVANVALAAPALTLAGTLQRKASRAGWPAEQVAPELAAAGSAAAALATAGDALDRDPSPAAAAALLWTVVAMLSALDIDAEAALRARSRAFRDAVHDAPTGL